MRRETVSDHVRTTERLHEEESRPERGFGHDSRSIPDDLTLPIQQSKIQYL